MKIRSILKKYRIIGGLLLTGCLAVNYMSIPVYAIDEIPVEVVSEDENTSENENISENENTSENEEMPSESILPEITEEDNPEILYAAGDVAINEANFPDANFRTYISDNFDSDKSGALSAGELSSVKELDCDGLEITSMNGTEFFTSLEYLYCGNNALGQINLSQNTNLLGLECTGNNLTSLDVSHNQKLEFITCDYNRISSINLSGCSNLEELCCGNNRLTSIGLTQCKELVKLDCAENSLTGLDVSACTKLADLVCSSNKLTSLNLGQNANLVWLYCSFNQLGSLDISGCPSLQCVECNDNQLQSLDVSKNASISMLYCTDEIGSIDISNNPYLLKVYQYGENYDGYHTMFDENGDMLELSLSPNVTVITEKPVIYPNGIGLNYDSMLIAVGEKRTLIVTIVPEDATDKSVTWTNTNPRVANLNGEGVVTATSAGITTISAITVNGLKKDCVITVLQEINPNNPFADVKSGSWKYNAAKYVYDNGYMTGKGELIPGKVIFSPDTAINRSQFVQTLYNMEGKPFVTYRAKFSDVKESDWFAKSVTWAEQNGIAAGNPDGTFGVEGTATREQMAVLFYKYAKYKGYDTSIVSGEGKRVNEFPDAGKASSWATEALNWALSRKIMSGKGTGILDPKGSATRVECATMVRNFMNEYKK